MANGGSFSTSSYKFASGTRCLTFNWSVQLQSVEDCETTIAWEIVGDGTYAYNPVCSDFYLEIDGDVVYDKPSSYHVNLYPGQVVASGTKTIQHDSDGSKSFRVYMELGIYEWDANCSGEETFTLTQIPRASAITSAASTVLGNKCSVKWTPKATSFYYKLVFQLGSLSKTVTGIAPKTVSAYTYTGYTIPVSWASQLPSAKTGTAKVTLTTHTASGCTDSDQIGDASTVTFTVTVPDSTATRPAVSMVLTPVSSLADAFDGLYIQGKSKVRAELEAEGKYGASISSYSMKVENASYGSAAEYTSAYLENAGDVTVYGYAKDSRGITGSVSETITVIGYSNPKILAASGESDVVAARCDAGGNLSDSGTYLKIKAKRSYHPVETDGKQYNFCRIQYRYKLESATAYSSWVTILEGDSLGSDEVETGALLGGVLAVDSTYLVQVRAIDDVGGYSDTTVPVPTDKVYMHRDKVKRALAIGKYIEEENCIDIAEDISLKIRSEKWIALGLSTKVALSEYDYGRGASGSGCWYRVVNGNHIHVAFNVSFTYSGSSVTVTSGQIPTNYRPSRPVYGLANVGGKYVARVLITTDGYVKVDWIQSLVTGTETTSYTVAWIDGYIDYFINV